MNDWASRKLWVTIAVLFLAAVLVASYAYVLVNAPEKVTALDTAVAAIAAIVAGVVGHSYVKVQGGIDQAALPANPNAPTVESVMSLIKELATLVASVVKATEVPAAAPAPPSPIPAAAETAPRQSATADIIEGGSIPVPRQQ
jgi:hypothetical protein